MEKFKEYWNVIGMLYDWNIIGHSNIKSSPTWNR